MWWAKRFRARHVYMHLYILDFWDWMFCENTLQKFKTQSPNTFYILTVWNKVEGLVLNTKLILFPGNRRLFLSNPLFQLLASVIDWHGAHQWCGGLQLRNESSMYSQPVWYVTIWTVGTCMWTWGQLSAYRNRKGVSAGCRLGRAS